MKSAVFDKNLLIKWLALTVAISRALCDQHSPMRNDGSVQPRAKGACGNIDIRNRVENFKKLENCSVIEGELHILLIDYAQPEDYNHLHFPDLVEITDHFLLYRVYGLKSLRKIFPNLAVIRGQNLFTNYALIAFEMPNLEELGLVSLTSIPRGAVRLTKNPELCYIETVDWTSIATGVALSENYFRENKDVKECVNRCPEGCPQTEGEHGNIPRCWTLNDCQKMLNCPSGCDFCNGSMCCNPNCLGGCSGPSSSDCHACKDVIQYPGQGQPNQKPICASRCSPGTYKYKNLRCLLASQCTNFTDYRNNGLKLWMPKDDDQQVSVAGECVEECPAKYKTDRDNSTRCVKCLGKCPKVCAGKVIDSINSAQELKGCTRISGPLEINIIGGKNVGKELVDSLKEIEQVDSFIRVYHASALFSLHFFQNLVRIKGEKLYQKSYSLVLYDNLNLQELFLESVAKNLVLENGTVFFQENRKLCMKKIDHFVKLINQTDKVTPEAIDRDTNGDQTPCEIQVLDFKLLQATPHIAILSWTNFNVTDSRHLISYTINYKEAPEKNVSIYEGRDACAADLWRVTEAPPDDDNKATVVHHFITNLKPWTQYAAYVQTLTISTATKGAMSNLIYFRTAPHVPTSPTKLKVKADYPGRLYVTWEPPNEPNGNVTHYEVYWQYRSLDPKQYELRDYCIYPMKSALKPDEEQEEEQVEKNTTKASICCQCPKSPEELEVEKREREMEIRFQDFLQNEVYIKRLERPASTVATRRAQSRTSFRNRSTMFRATTPTPHQATKYTKTDAPTAGLVHEQPAVKLGEIQTTSTTTTTTPSLGKANVTTAKPMNETKKKENPYYKAIVYDKFLIIPNLGHFEDYNIEVIACQERDPRHPDQNMLCSNRAIGLGRTLRNDTADNINETSISVTYMKNTSNAVRIEWDDPPKPNGLIITYDVEYKITTISNVKPHLICLTYKEYRDKGNRGHVLTELGSGNYTFRIRATSLAGNGSWTEYHSFLIHSVEDDPVYQKTLIAMLVTGSVVLVFVTIAVVWCVAKKRFGNKIPETFHTSANPDYFLDYDVYEPDEWEVDRDFVELIKELGQGSFGMVYEGRVKQETDSGESVIKVAVKTTNAHSSDQDRYNFLQEASTMKAFRCHHVVQLMGVVSKGQPAYVLMELMDNGDLKNFLRLHRPDEEENNGRQPPTLKQIMQIAGEIADGMAYLADKKFVHRDLAARNCMVAEDMTVKIGDFGMTRDIYETDYYRKGNRGLLPVRWMAPESLRDGLFTSMSDVWSYGVVLWEMATLAAQPYQGLSNEEVLRYVGSGRIMDKPDGCPPKLYDMMVKCWRYRHKQRPTFKEIIELLLPDLDKKFKEVSYFFSEENVKQTKPEDPVDSVSLDHAGPEDDYIDEVSRPFLEASAACDDQGTPLEDILTDSAGYPWSPKNVGSEPCDCTLFKEMDEGAAAPPEDIYHRQSICSNPTSAIGGGSSDGSKGSSKSSGSSYRHINGVSVANGHVPVQIRMTNC